MKKHASKQDLHSSQNLDAPGCDDHLVHLDNVRVSIPKLLPVNEAQEMAEVFSLLADANRLRLISALASQELCVCDLAALTKITESAVCHQLRLLKAMRFVKYRREGRKVYYSLAGDTVVQLYNTLAKSKII
ncbi:MAG: metalloregulator ArsR/SmtB family transcription factor [Scytonematopsis contorta HA4267-MV1]|jgi:DNA-binding transcriptional ArsR family regulator|nr:metalloregulator ArsR/SmtB family transcription factor [Scytonematopsis contorta HA4267-MV1]